MKKDWRAFWEIYESAAALAPEERLSFIQTSDCTAELGQELLTLLERLEQGSEPAKPKPASFNSDKTVVNKHRRYVLMQELGRGGMSRVFAARDIELDRLVAIKFLPAEALADAPVEKLVREAQAASALNHPNIVTVHEVIESESGFGLVMEMVQGDSLRTLAGRAIPNEQLIHFGSQTAKALALAHAHGIIHRDIKPENILVRDDGYIKLLDFGLAHKLETGIDSFEGASPGTLRYMSPEQVRCERLTPATDVFSFGVVLYELATGVHPFEAASPFEVVHRAGTLDPTPPAPLNPALPPGLARLIVAMLAKKPELRPTAEAISDELDQMDYAEQHVRKPARLTTVAVLAALSLVVIALGILFLRNRLSPKEQSAFRQITTAANENRVTAADLTRDARSLIFADATGAVHLRDWKSGYSRVLCTIPHGHLNKVAWLPDHASVLLSGFEDSTEQFDIWTLRLPGDTVKMLRSDATQALPSPDGEHIAFLNADSSEIWVMNSDGSSARRIITNRNPGAFESMLWSHDGQRLSFTRRRFLPGRKPGSDLFFDSAVIQSDYETTDARSGKLLGTQPANGLSKPFAIRNGQVFFIRRKGAIESLVEVRTDPLTGKFLEEPRTLATRPENDWMNVVGVTSDGRNIVMLLNRWQQSNVYVGQIDPKTACLTHEERLTFNTRRDFPHAWMPDSQTVVFESNRNNDWQIFKQRLGESDAEQVVLGSTTDVMPQVSPDGQWILFLHNPRYLATGDAQSSKRVWTLMRVPAAGGQPQPIPGGDAVEEYQCAEPGGRRCVLRALENGQFVFYDLDPVRGKGRELTRVAAHRYIFGDWGVSPDGSYAALPDHNSPRCTFRVIDLEHSDRREITRSYADIPTLVSVFWATGRPGWYITVFSSGMELRYLDVKGRSQRLWESDVPTWPLISPDGRKLAFVGGSVDSNIWTLDR